MTENHTRPQPESEPEYLGGELADEYFAALDAGLAERESWIPEDRNEVWIPLSAGLWPVKSTNSTEAPNAS